MHPAVEALEQQQAALTGLLYDLRNPRNRPAEYQERLAWKDAVIVLQRATPFWWGRKCVEVATTLGKDFDLNEIKTERELLYTDYAFHWFETPLLMAQAPDAGILVPVKAISWAWGRKETGGALFMTAWVPLLDNSRVIPFMYGVRTEGNPLKGTEAEQQNIFGEPVETETDHMLGFAATASTFLRQKLLRTEVALPPGIARKRLEKHARRVISQSVQAVLLRKAAPRKEGDAPSSELTEWSCSWSVRGHVRQQWYPSLEKHLPVYIHPYLKGPEDKPLKPRTTQIMVVNR